MRLIDALRYSPPDCLVFVGAGGKTTALFQAAREIIGAAGQTPQHSARTVIVTTTTHLGEWQAHLADRVFKVNDGGDIELAMRELPRGVVLISGEGKDDRLGSLRRELLVRLQHLARERHVPLLIEADGARGRPIKAPAAHEPAIPDFAHQVVVVAGMAGIGLPLSKESVHRENIFAELAGLQLGDPITLSALIKVLSSEKGGLKNIPATARRQVLINQADTQEMQSSAKSIGKQLVPVYESCVIASLRRERGSSPDQMPGSVSEIYAVIEPIAGIILAAGGSSRFGQPKQLLPWKNQPFIRHVALTALQAGLSPVVAVTGANAQEVAAAIKDLPVRIVNNSHWNEGISSSIKAGIQSLQGNIGGAVFMQADQPHIPHALVENLVQKHQSSLSAIVAPQVDGRHGNPVLFDRSTFAQLVTLEGDMGGRALFSHNPIEWVEWPDRGVLLDIDTPEDYQNFLELYPREEAQE